MNPYSKQQQLHSNKIPSRKKRAEFTDKQRKEVKHIYGKECIICMNPYVTIHHRHFRSQFGRNNPRNGAPLCNDCHQFVHSNQEAAEELRQQAIKRFGPYYYYDKYDCYQKGLIADSTNSLFEEFMQAEEIKAAND